MTITATKRENKFSFCR